MLIELITKSNINIGQTKIGKKINNQEHKTLKTKKAASNFYGRI